MDVTIVTLLLLNVTLNIVTLGFVVNWVRKTRTRSTPIDMGSETSGSRQGDVDTLILDLYLKGYSYREIARRVGVSHTTVYRKIKKLMRNLEPPESVSDRVVRSKK